LFLGNSLNILLSVGSMAQLDYERENLLSAYGIPNPHSFTSLDRFKKTCNHFYTLLEEGEESSPYLGFIHVTMSNFETIDEVRERRATRSTLPKMTIFYDWNEETLIVKFRVGVYHEACARLLAMEFYRVYANRTGDVRAFFPLGSAKFKGTWRMKEGNEAYKPRTRTKAYDWPSIVFEVGVCETMVQLQQDARFWLESSGGETRIVIIVCINQNARSMEIQRWHAVVAATATPLRQQPARHMQRANPYARCYIAIHIQSLVLAKGQNYVGPSLHIPTHLVYDIVPPGLGPNDFDMTTQILNEINTDYWSGL
jgi:hypothetical protein